MLEDGAHEDVVAVADVRVQEAQGARRQLSVEEDDDLDRCIQDRDDLRKKRSGRGEGVRHKRRWNKRGKGARAHPEFTCRIRDGGEGVPASMEASGMNGRLI
jgi:hypothetical protein